MQPRTPPDDDDILKKKPELDSYTALQLEWRIESCKVFISERKVNRTRYDDETKWSVFTMIRSSHEENNVGDIHHKTYR